MKVIIGILGGILLATVAQAQSGLKLGELSIAGSACRDNHENLSLQRWVLQIPLEASVQKSSSQQIASGACSFSLPIQMKHGYRLIVRDLLASGDVKLYRETKSRVRLEVFAAGERGEILEREDGSKTQKVSRSIRLRQEGDVFVSECGASLILRGNTSIQVAGAKRGTVNLDEIQMVLETERCH